MLKLKRRRFLQIIGAAGVTPAIPALPAGAAEPAPAPVARHSQMLWASLAKQGGTAPSMVGVSKAMGVSGTATRGICAKLVQANLVSARHAANIGHVAVKSVRAVKQASGINVMSGPRLKVDVVKFLTEDVDAEQEALADTGEDGLVPGDAE